MKLINVQNQKFGRLLVLYRTHNNWHCVCDCGTQINVSGHKLHSGHTASCGCLRKEVTAANASSHGATRNGTWTPEYRAWVSMKTRCTYKNRPDYMWYGKHGIKVCERWLSSFQNFLSDVGMRPSKTHSIDRINVNGHYEPSNVRWATRREQAFNKRNSLKNRTPVAVTQGEAA